MEYGKWKTESLQSPLSSPSDSWSAPKCNSNKNNFISKPVLRGGFQFAALPCVTIKDFSTKQFIFKILIFFFNLSDVFSEKQTPLFTDCLSYWRGRALKYRSRTPGPVRDPSLRTNCGKAPLEVTQH